MITYLRYQLPRKAIKSDCPQCGPQHHRTLSRYVDTRTNDPLPEQYGRCDRESNCTYHLSPYHKGSSGQSYADEVYHSTREQRAERQAPIPRLVKAQPKPVCTIPDELLRRSMGHYEDNRFARLLQQQFGQEKATELLQRFQIGTSKRWPGACIFWYVDEQNRVCGGQIKLLDNDWHTVKYVDATGRKRAKVDWVHSALKYGLEREEKPLPDWLQHYIDNAERSPCLFGLPQLQTAPPNQPVAVVEAPKTAVICSAVVPGFIWLAVGSLSYLTLRTETGRQRLAPLRGRQVKLFPDLNGFDKWNAVAAQLRAEGFSVQTSDYLEKQATVEQKKAGLDLADFLLMPETNNAPD